MVCDACLVMAGVTDVFVSISTIFDCIVFADMYTFDVDKASALVSYELVREAYRKIFARLELPVVEGVFYVGRWCACMCVCVML